MPKKHIYILLLSIIIIAGAVLRFYRLSDQSFWMDEGYTVNAIISGLQNGHNNLSAILDSGKAYFCPIYCYPTEILVKIFGHSPIVFRLFSVISGIIFILIIFIIAKYLFNDQIALLAAFFTAFSYWQIVWSRQARWYTLWAVFFWLALLYFYKSLYAELDAALKKRRMRIKNGSKIIYGSLAFGFAMLAVFTHRIGVVLPLFMLFWIGVEAYLSKNIALLKYFSAGLGFFTALTFCLEYIFEINFISGFLSKLSFHYELPYYLNFYLRHYWLLIIFALMAVFNFKDKKKIYFILLPILAYLIPLAFFTDIVHYRYLFHAAPALYILAAAGIFYFYKKIKIKYKKIIFITLVIAAFFLSHGVLRPKSLYNLESDDPSSLKYRPHYAYTPQPNFKTAYDIIKNNIKPEEIIISSHPVFNKIYLNCPGYWLKYSYSGIENKVKAINQDREYYVGAKVIDDLEELKNITSQAHGYFLFDYMAADNRIPAEIINYATNNFKQIYYNEINSYSKVWVYEF